MFQAQYVWLLELLGGTTFVSVINEGGEEEKEVKGKKTQHLYVDSLKVNVKYLVHANHCLVMVMMMLLEYETGNALFSNALRSIFS